MILLLGTFALLAPSLALAKPHASKKPAKQLNWQACGAKLVRKAGLHRKWETRIPNQFYSDSVDKSPQFLSYLLAMAYVESRFDDAAKSGTGARGILQVTRIGAEAAAEVCFLPILTGQNLLLLHKPNENVLYASCLLKRYLEEAHGNWKHALITYNGGYLQLKGYLGTGTLSYETENYLKRVLAVRTECLYSK